MGFGPSCSRYLFFISKTSAPLTAIPIPVITRKEMIEYLLQRKRRDQERPAFENYSIEHVLAFQRRLGALKENFMRRGERTPLGKTKDWWDGR